jgi:hypothetical protein
VKTEIVYETNADYHATYEKLVESGVIVADQTGKGLIWFRVKGTRTVFTLSPYGKLQVKWNNVEEKKILLRIVKNLLVPTESQKLRMRPAGQQAFIPYPVPPNLKLYWCDEETEYVRKPLNTRRREPLIITLIGTLFMSIFGFMAINDLSRTALTKVGNQTGMEMLRIMFQVAPYLVIVPAIALVSMVLLMARRTGLRRLLFSGFGD